MSEPLSLMVAGAARTNEHVTVFSPYDSQVLATLDAADGQTVELALSHAHQAFTDRSLWLSVPQRIEILQKTAGLMSAQQEELALLAAREGGKPLQDSRVEVTRAIEGIQLCIDCLRNDAGQVIPMGLNAASMNRMAYTQQEPIGVVVAVSAFNHPLNLIVHQVGPAIASGCPVIVKPAEDTPLSCYRLVSILREAGLPDIWCQTLVVKEIAIATRLVTDERVAFFTFIGSAKVGWKLRSSLAAGTRCALEHGGVAPVIVEPDADIHDALPLLAKGGFYHSGQVCVSVQRVFCHQSIAREVAEGLAKLAGEQVFGDPTHEQTTMGPLIRAAELERVGDWVNQAIKEGAECLAGGAAQGTGYQATVLYEPSVESLVSQQEIFGPVICVYSYDDVDAAIEIANGLPYAFQASVFTQSMDKAMHISQRLAASAVMVNDHTAFRVDWMPFAGLRQSGLGVGGIPYTFEDMQIDKMTVIRSPEI